MSPDTIPPLITGCPDTIEIMIPVGMSSVNATWIEPTATDNSGITPTVTKSHQPGDSFPIGLTQVTYTFTDLAGNVATCEFSIVIGKTQYYLFCYDLVCSSFVDINVGVAINFSIGL